MKNRFLFFACLLFLPFLNAQQPLDQLLDLRKELETNRVYTAPKLYKYQVTKLDANGDTLSTECVNMRIPTELNTEIYEDGKIYFIWEYSGHDTYEEALGLRSKLFNEKDWMLADTTTMRFNEEDLYLHPMRENQYYQAEVAAHPSVKFMNFIDDKYKSKIVILKGFGKYNMQEYTSLYSLSGKSTYILNDKKLDCYELTAETSVKGFSFGSAKGEKNNIFGEKPVINTTTFWVNEKYGFVKIYYQFYDGEELYLEMVE